MLTSAATSRSLGAVTTSTRSYGQEVQTQHWRITLDELRENFRLPEKEVAKKLGAFEEDLSPPWNLPLALSQGARLRSRAIFPPRHGDTVHSVS